MIMKGLRVLLHNTYNFIKLLTEVIDFALLVCHTVYLSVYLSVCLNAFNALSSSCTSCAITHMITVTLVLRYQNHYQFYQTVLVTNLCNLINYTIKLPQCIKLAHIPQHVLINSVGIFQIVIIPLLSVHSFNVNTH